MPDGRLFNWCNRIGFIMDPLKGEYLVRLPDRPDRYIVQFPFTGTSVMLMLKPEDDYALEVMQIGGALVDAVYDLNISACKQSMRMKVRYDGGAQYDDTAGYAIDQWIPENMGAPRVMPDAVLLPNGCVVLLNGAARGVAGDAASGGGSRASYPAFFAEMYDPEAPRGQRWATLARSQIARLYHSTAALTSNGTILTTGCDRCAGKKVVTDLEFSSVRAKAEYRNEIFYPPHWFEFNKKPLVTRAPISVGFGEDFVVEYTGEYEPSVVATGATLVAPSSVTHSFNTNQRVIKLLLLNHDPDAKRMLFRSPPTPNHAPPQMYMLFLLNEQVYSKAVWVTLRRGV